MTADISTHKPVIKFAGVRQVFGTNVAVQSLDLEVQRGEKVAILGQTGAGKSTVMNLLVGNLEPSEGSVEVEGRNPFVEHRALQGRIGMAFQGPRLLPWRSATDNVAIGQEILGVPNEERLQNAREWLNKMQLSDAYDLYPNQLSGGMRQRVSLARAFAIRPAFVLLDEAFSALDEVTAKDLRRDFKALTEAEKQTAIIVTHNIEEAFDIADRVIVLGRPARILAEFRTAEHPPAGSAEFSALRSSIHETMIDAAQAAA